MDNLTPEAEELIRLSGAYPRHSNEELVARLALKREAYNNDDRNCVRGVLASLAAGVVGAFWAYHANDVHSTWFGATVFLICASVVGLIMSLVISSIISAEFRKEEEAIGTELKRRGLLAQDGFVCYFKTDAPATPEQTA